METNPYAPPESAMVNPHAAPTGFGEPQPWDLSEVLVIAWDRFKQDWAVLVGAMIVSALLRFAIAMVVEHAYKRIDPFSQDALVRAIVRGHFHPSMLSHFLRGLAAKSVFDLALTAFLSVGMTRIYLASARGQRPEFGLLFGGFDRHISYVAAALVVMIAAYAGTVLLIFPGLLLGSCLYFGLFYVADSAMNPFACLSAAWRASSGQRLKLVAFMFVTVLILYSGALACGIGMVVTTPLSALAWAIVYTRLSGSAAAQT